MSIAIDDLGGAYDLQQVAIIGDVRDLNTQGMFDTGLPIA